MRSLKFGALAFWSLAGNFALAFQTPLPQSYPLGANSRVASASTKSRSPSHISDNGALSASKQRILKSDEVASKFAEISVTAVTVFLSLSFAIPGPAEASTASSSCVLTISESSLQSAFWSYGHILAIMGITGCLVAERLLIKPCMSVEDEETIVKIDLLYGLFAALLIVSGFVRASTFGKGGDFYIHELSFWLKMTMGGIWGGLSLFPSLTFYKRKSLRKDNTDTGDMGETNAPVSDALAARLTSVINAELSAILTIPLLAALVARGLWYWPDFPWQIGMVVSLAATGGSFFLYGRQALTWSEDSQSQVDENM